MNNARQDLGAQAPAITSQTDTPADEAETHRAWVKRVTTGERGADGLTVDERIMLIKLKSAGYELVRSAYRERYTGRAA